MERNIKNWLPFYVGYLGEVTFHELSYLIKESEEDTFNELEVLVKKGKLERRVVSGELTYRIKKEEGNYFIE